MEGLSWEVIGILSTINVAIMGVMVGAIRLLLKQYQKDQDGRFGAVRSDITGVSAKIDGIEGKLSSRIDDNEHDIEKVRSAMQDRVQAVKDELKDYKTQVAETVVHRRDWVRVEGSRDVTLRKIFERLEELTKQYARTSNR